MEPLPANSWTEALLYLKVTPCRHCGQGPWELRDPPPDPASGPPGGVRRLRASCVHCGAEREFVFRCEGGGAGDELAGLDIERINPTPRPSRIIDLAQWLSLFQMMVEAGAQAEAGDKARRLTFQAAQCLDEALKFYPADDDLPPPPAFFTDRGRQVYAEHPEKFARQRLRGMRERLPDLGVMARRLGRDARSARPRRWWQLWKR